LVKARGFSSLLIGSLLAAAAVAPATGASNEVRLDGYAEWRRGDVLIVDGQRVRAAAKLRFKGSGEAHDMRSIPLGYEVSLKGTRLIDGTVLARELEAKPNGDALFEGDLRAAFDAKEKYYKSQRRMIDEDDKGHFSQDYGRLSEDGPDVERVRRITRKLVPAYLRPEDFRVYVVENKDWNAVAAPNRSIYVFDGLLRDLDDDEVAIVLGHELCHATHEHSRKQFKKQMLIQLAALGVVAGAEGIDSSAKRIALQAIALIGASAWTNGYGRTHEDQADRVGLRYTYEAGFDARKGPALWMRFAKKYGEAGKLATFFFSDHSQSAARARNLEHELALNYR
jgi:Zn-dependent protease with chaperone function